MKGRLIYNNENQHLIQLALDQQHQRGMQDIGSQEASDHKNVWTLLDDCLKRGVSHLVVFELTLFGDRLDRIIKTLSMFFKHSIQIDLYTNEKAISLNSFASFSEEVFLVLFNNLRTLHKRKIRHGQTIAKQSGKKIGRKPHISTDQIKALKNEGLSIREISQKTGISITSTWRHSRELSEQ